MIVSLLHVGDVGRMLVEVPGKQTYDACCKRS